MRDSSEFERLVRLAWPPADWSNDPILVGVSGGADSVALLRALVSVQKPGRGEIVVAHFNHRLRGAESDEDERFVVNLARSLTLACEVGRAAEAAGVHVSEEAARETRWNFLRDAARKRGSRYVVVAHTADDQAETILHRVLRGTSLAGLAGIPRARELMPGVGLLRPLLEIRRAAAREYLELLGQPWREDASNLDRSWTRNRLRHELLPAIERDYNPQAVEALVRLGRLAAEANEVLDAAARDLLERATLRRDAVSIELDCRVLGKAPRYLVRAALVQAWDDQGWSRQTLGAEPLEALADMVADADNQATRFAPGSVHAQRDADRLILTRR